jgi:Flp pilus assembly pilin Flp
MNRPTESEGGAATPKAVPEVFGVTKLGVAPQHRGSKTAAIFSSSLVGVMSSAASLRRPRTRREVKQVQKLFDSLYQREEGQTMAEYGVVLAVITIAVFGALSVLSGNIEGAVSRVASYIT